MGFEIILSLLLFVITLIIILLLRAEDKRSHSLEVMKNRMGQFIRRSMPPAPCFAKRCKTLKSGSTG